MLNTTRTINTAGVNGVSVTDDFLVIDTLNSGGAITILLPSIDELAQFTQRGSGYNADTYNFKFSDVGGNAQANNIIIKPKGANLVNGSASVTLNTNGINGFIQVTGNNDWILMTSNEADSGNITANSVVRLATTANIILSGLQTIDGVLTVAGDRVLVKNQTAASQNGIYVAASGGWTRAVDIIYGAMLVLVQEGAFNQDSAWILVTNEPIVVGITALDYQEFPLYWLSKTNAEITTTKNSTQLRRPAIYFSNDLNNNTYWRTVDRNKFSLYNLNTNYLGVFSYAFTGLMPTSIAPIPPSYNVSIFIVTPTTFFLINSTGISLGATPVISATNMANAINSNLSNAGKVLASVYSGGHVMLKLNIEGFASLTIQNPPAGLTIGSSTMQTDRVDVERIGDRASFLGFLPPTAQAYDKSVNYIGLGSMTNFDGYGSPNIKYNFFQEKNFFTTANSLLVSNIATIESNFISSSSSMELSANSGAIMGNSLSSGAKIKSLNGSITLQNNKFYGLGSIEFLYDTALGGGFTNCDMDLSIFSSISTALTHSGKSLRKGYSDFEAELDITGLTTIDLSLIPSYIGVVKLTSTNPTETISKIDNFTQTNHSIKFYCEAGLTVTFTGTPIANPPAANDIVLTSGASISIVGRTQLPDSASFKRDGFIGETNKLNYL